MYKYLWPLRSISARRVTTPHSWAKISSRASTSQQQQQIRTVQTANALGPAAKMAEKVDYAKWTKDSLIEKVRELENELKRRPEPAAAPVPAESSNVVVVPGEGDEEQPPPKKRKEKKEADPSKYSHRFVALKLAYLGRNYGGFEYSQSGVLPSIEEELFKALTKARLIFPEDDKVFDLNNCEYSKCGRTDRGVSAFGQVIALKVRSARPLPGQRRKRQQQKAKKVKAADQTEAQTEDQTAQPEGEEAQEEAEPPFDPIKDELQYPRLLNRLLPRDIRILAWCPSPPPDFSARFSCRERQYRYFFTQPAFTPPGPTPAQENAGWLDIDLMREAARRFEGEHDFRNFCKVDPAKNITNYHRRILEATVEEVPGMSSSLPYLDASAAAAVGAGGAAGSYPKVYCFKVRGTAFLWHQIRNMVSVLFSIAQRLETPDLVSQLLDVQTNPRRPVYVMADETPLVLWDCLFPGENGEGSLEWVHAEDGVEQNKAATTFGAATEGAWELWRETKMDEILANGLLQTVTKDRTKDAVGAPAQAQGNKKGDFTVKLFEGGNAARPGGKYVPTMQKKLMDSVQEQSDKYAQRKGFKDAQDMADQRAAKWAEANAAAQDDGNE